jgi:hypothetical protein
MLALRWAWFVLIVLALAYTARVTRYEVTGQVVFDRWTQQYCTVVSPYAPAVCDKMSDKLSGGSQARARLEKSFDFAKRVDSFTTTQRARWDSIAAAK